MVSVPGRWRFAVDRIGFGAGCVVLAVLSAVGCARPSAEAPVRRLVVIGDSLSVYPSADQSFPAELQRRIDEQGLPWTVTNGGISGDTTSGGAARLDDALAGDVGAIVIALGANDGLRGVNVATVETNLAAMIERARERHVRVLLCGMETPPTHGFAYSLAFRRIYPRLAKKYAVPLVPFLLSGVALAPEMNGPDGVHPNVAGARQIAETIWPYLKPMFR
jgi:acyl-CoA thioesterase-1